MHLFERCAALLLAELEAREIGDRVAADSLRSERDALRDAWEGLASAPGAAAGTFADALSGATTELAHREEVEARLRERLRSLSVAAARRLPPSAPGAAVAAAPPPRSGPRLVDGRKTPVRTLNITF